MSQEINSKEASQIVEDKNGYRWITCDNGLYIYDGTNYIHCLSTENPNSLSASHVNSIMTDNRGNIWAATQKGIDRYDDAALAFIHYEIDDNNHYILDIAQNPEGDIYAISRLFLFKLDKNSGIFKKQLKLRATGEKARLSIDSDGSVWIDYQSLSDRISFTSGRTEVVETLIPVGDAPAPFISRRERTVLSELETRDVIRICHRGGAIWALCNDAKLLKFSSEENRLLDEWDIHEIIGPDSSPWYDIKICGDGQMLLVSDGAMWLLDISGGEKPGIKCSYDTSFNPKATGSVSADGTLWISGGGAAIYYSSTEPKGKEPNGFSELEDVLPDISIDCWRNLTLKDGTIAFGFSDIGIVLLDPVSRQVKLTRLPDDIKQIFISDLFEASDGKIWISTSDNGLLVYDKTADRYESIDALDHQIIASVTEDNKGIIYINTYSGVYIYRDGKIQDLWHNSTGSPSMMITMPDGEVFLNNGHSYLQLNTLTEGNGYSVMPPLSVILCSKGKIISIDKSGGENRTVRLNFKAIPEGMHLYASCLEYSSNRAVNYWYRFGNREWRQAINSTDIPLYRIQYGTNRIKIKAVDVATSAESGVIDLRLNMRRPLFHFLIAFFALGTIAALAVLIRQQQKKKKETERIQENIDFLSNISHEFRTPLTLVNGAVETLAASGLTDGNESRMIKVIQRNTARMMKLVSQLLDFNRIEHNTLTLSVAKCDISSMMTRIMDMFSLGAEQKSIDLHLEGCEQERIVWVDADKIEKMMFNLISNALKYTPPSGKVTVKVEMKGKNLCIMVDDTGIGVPNGMHDAIFERYIRTDEGKKVAGGCGIGLYYTKALAEIHHGSVSVKNNDAGGACFTIIVPAGADDYTDKEKQEDTDTFKSIDIPATRSEFIIEQKEAASRDKPSILIIDDDYEIVHYLKMLLEKDYLVDFRYDAVSGYAQMNKKMPDIVICDVMMVDVDGFQFCRMAKENDATCHIPIVLLTAKSTVQDQITGFSEGADAYIVKPFNNDYLQAVLSSLLENRRRIQKLIQGMTSLPKDGIEGISSKDKNFLDRLNSLMEESLLEGELDIDTIAGKLGYSRTKLFYKVKAIAGQTPNEFFTTYKLNRSLELLAAGKYKISAVASMVGFSSASHFSTLFKKKFGILPSQYRK